MTKNQQGSRRIAEDERLAALDTYATNGNIGAEHIKGKQIGEEQE